MSERAQPRVVVITAGGTREPIDDVRYVSNAATGQLPAAIADVLLRQGHTVHYIHGPEAVLPGHARLNVDVRELTADQLRERTAAWLAQALALQSELTGHLHLHPIHTALEVTQTLQVLCARLQPDAVACAMAVADFAPVASTGKLSSRRDVLELHMTATQKAIDIVKAAAPRTHLLGFKLLSHASEAELLEAGLRLIQRAGADAVFCNDMADLQRGVRRGLVLGASGTIVARLDGGTGAPGLADLAAGIVRHGLPV